MSDIVERLLELEHRDICYPVPHPVCAEAAAEITRLRENLKDIANAANITPSSDIAERLLSQAAFEAATYKVDTFRLVEAAAEITHLRAENERLSTSLSNTANARVLQGKAIAELSAENERLREALLEIFDHECHISNTSFIAATARAALWPTALKENSDE